MNILRPAQYYTVWLEYITSTNCAENVQFIGKTQCGITAIKPG